MSLLDLDLIEVGQRWRARADGHLITVVGFDVHGCPKYKIGRSVKIANRKYFTAFYEPA